VIDEEDEGRLAVDARHEGWMERCVRGFVFPTERKARAACAIAKRALADAQSNRTPEPWEALALAAGWTPPKKRAQ